MKENAEPDKENVEEKATYSKMLDDMEVSFVDKFDSKAFKKQKVED